MSEKQALKVVQQMMVDYENIEKVKAEAMKNIKSDAPWLHITPVSRGSEDLRLSASQSFVDMPREDLALALIRTANVLVQTAINETANIGIVRTAFTSNINVLQSLISAWRESAVIGDEVK